MNNIIINNESYDLPEIKDIPIGLVIELSEVWNNKNNSNSREDKTDYQQLLTKICPGICGQILNAVQFIKSYAAYICEEASGALGNYSDIAWDAQTTDEEVTLPNPDEGYNGELVYLPEITAGDFMDATDLLMLNHVKYSPVIISILCNNGQSNGKEYLQKVPSIKSKPFALAISVINMLTATHRDMKAMFPYCYGAGIADSYELTTGTTWNDALIITARAIPSEIESFRKMNAYEFMNILNCKNKYRFDHA